VIERDAYRLTDDWNAVVDRLDEVQSEFFETLYRRVKAPPPRESLERPSLPHRATQAASRLVAQMRNRWGNAS